MEQTMPLTRNGWSEEETQMLWQEIRAAAENGAPLRGVFERMGQALGRKPNSVRNYYYMQLRGQGDASIRRAAPFETFTEEQVHALLRTVLQAKGEGQSVRACVTAMAEGDRARMLRYQNKYRAILRKHPEMIDSVCRELEQEKLPWANPLDGQKKQASVGYPRVRQEAESDPDVQAIMRGLDSLTRRAREGGAGDRLKVQRDLLMMQLEDVQLAAREMLAVCKDFLGNPAEERPQKLSAFCRELSQRIARLESVSG